ncbi:hypothetical protein [Paramicrobacterium chengjingii]|uniref:hypothetical protein n=1 Tax=Paramicrobacterium chengjingii TaxID=2769067 RepID=UPI0014203BDE|nr:hypothetical protein [Microbacterium chengjingii]
MVRIDRNPALASLRFILITVTGVSFLFAGVVSALFDGPFRYVLGYLLIYAVFIGLIFGIVALRYRGLSWDSDKQTARFGKHVVPLESITEAWRTMSDTRGSAAYLTYRFISTTGHSVRVLIVGTPLKGLTETGLAELERFVTAIPIDDGSHSDGQLTEAQHVLIDSITPDGGTSRVGRAPLLHELRERRGVDFLRSAVPDQKPEAQPHPASDARLHAAQAADDSSARQYLVAHRPRGAQRARRMLFSLISIVVVVACVTIAVAVVLETIRGSQLDSGTNAVIGSVVGSSLFAGVLLYAGWCIAADRDVRGLRNTAKAWLNSRDATRRERGLALPLFAGWNEPAPGARLRNLLSFASAMIGMTGVVSGPVLIVQSYSLLTAAIAFGVGLVFSALAIMGYVKSHRERRASARELIVLAGPRLLPSGEAETLP